MHPPSILSEAKKCLAAAYGDRLKAVLLFGSEARGEALPESDIDLVVVLEGPAVDYGEELERSLTAVYPLAVRIGRRISVKPLLREVYEGGDSPLLRELRRTGVAA
jgi:predicted nucleotidyltransferase